MVNGQARQPSMVNPFLSDIAQFIDPMRNDSPGLSPRISNFRFGGPQGKRSPGSERMGQRLMDRRGLDLAAAGKKQTKRSKQGTRLEQTAKEAIIAQLRDTVQGFLLLVQPESSV